MSARRAPIQGRARTRARAPARLEADLAHCREAIRTGSRSFHAASRLLPARVREPALALYAFCRLADDAVDEEAGGAAAKARAVEALAARLDAAYRGVPREAPADRAFAAVVARVGLPRALPEALIEGLAWDAEGRRYESLADLHAYGARVAGSVGAMMCVVMGVRSPAALARACDLGLAMQLTNIARDVGEDARAGRLFLPTGWLAEAGVEPEAFLADPSHDPRIAAVTERLLAEAGRLYRRAGAGVPALPLGARAGIYAAAGVYAGIGGAVRRAGYDSVTARARTGAARKGLSMGLAAGRAAASLALPRHPALYAPPVPEAAFLVAAAARPVGAWGEGRAGVFLGALAALKARDMFPGPAHPGA